jgi:endonuclease/exonuclease/phosphatase family metal-dependent hydrolase
MKKLSLFLVALTVCSGTLTFLTAGSIPAKIEDPHPATLRVLTYNTWFTFNEQKAKARGIQLIKNETPDITVLQELVDIQPDLLQSLAESWGHPHSSLQKTKGYSVGVTSRWPIQVVEKVVTDEGHGYLHVVIKEIHVFSIHLHPFGHDKRQREAGVLTKKIIPLLKQKKKVIVAGDFNAHSQDDEELLNAQPQLLKNYKDSDTKHGLNNLRDGNFDFQVMDTFFKAELIDSSRNLLAKTTAARTTYGDPSKTGQRIDFILTDPTLFKTVQASRVIIPEPFNGPAISDHYPVVSDFRSKVPE